MTTLPTVPFGDHQITRLIIGGNPFCGHSHQSAERNEEMRRFFTAEKVVKTLRLAQGAGINTFQGRGDFHRVMYWLELFRREGGRLHWIGQTASEMHDVRRNIRVIAANGAIGVYHHGSVTDSLWKEGKRDEVRDRLKAARDTGIRVGLGTHMPEVIEYAEEHGWDVDFYMACLYNISRIDRQSPLAGGVERFDEPFFADDPPRMCRTIRATDKQCLAFKVLAAGRLCETPENVAEAFRFTFANIKPTDAVVVGMFPNEIEANVRYTAAAIEAVGAE